MTKNKVEKKPPLAIVGTAGSYVETPWDDETVEIWAVATLLTKPDVERIDRVFEMHPRRYWGQPNVLPRYTECKVPIYMQDHYDEIPGSVRVPYEEIKKKFYHPSMGENLFVTNTIVWMLLCALHEGYTDISLYGVHMAHQTEYGYQNASCSWVLGMIQGWIVQGLPYKLYIAEASELLKARYEYGYAEPTAAMKRVKEDIDKLQNGVNMANERIVKARNDLEQTQGALTYAKGIYNYLAGYR